MPKIIISVTNDLNSDQRVLKICETFGKLSYEILLIGRKLPKSLPIERPYQTHRMRLIFNKGFLFYASFNLRLFFKLLFSKTDLLYANDLDTLLPNYIVAGIRRKKLIYDSHELFTEIPELKNRPLVKGIWLTIEQAIFRHLKNVITVNQSIADFYRKKYGVKVQVIKNLSPSLKLKKMDVNLSNELKAGRKMLILQGAGINIDRGAEEAIQMMQYLNNVVLVIIGKGDQMEALKKLVNSLELKNVVFKPWMPYDQMMEFTKIADLGLSLDKDTNLNYKYSLPNKIFDYIQAGIPLLVSNRDEVSKIVEDHGIGEVLLSYDAEKMAEQVSAILNNEELLIDWRKQVAIAAVTHNWEHQEEKLIYIINNLV